MKAKSKYGIKMKSAISAVLVVAFLAAISTHWEHCLCNTHLPYSAIESGSCCQNEAHHFDHDCCGYCLTGVHSHGELLAIPQAPMRLPSLNPPLSAGVSLSFTGPDPRFTIASSAFLTGPPARPGPAVHIRSTVLLI